jgi:hypothetical protein
MSTHRNKGSCVIRRQEVRELANNESGLTRSERKILDLSEIITRSKNEFTLLPLRTLMGDAVFHKRIILINQQSRTTPGILQYSSRNKIGNLHDWSRLISMSRSSDSREWVRESTIRYLSGVKDLRDGIQEYQGKRIRYQIYLQVECTKNQI